MKNSTTTSVLVGIMTIAAFSMPRHAQAYTRLTPPPPDQSSAVTASNVHADDVTSSGVAGSGQKRLAGINDPGRLPDTDEASYPVPEPETMALTSFGLLALGLFARKRQPKPSQDSPLTT